jgi:hypothetical protein
MRKSIRDIFNLHHVTARAHHGVHHRHGRSALVMVVLREGVLRE